MSTLGLLFHKEMLEFARNYKWLWIPIVFLLLGVMNPVSNYFMPDILMMSGIDEATAKLIPVPTPAETMAQSLSQYGTIGLLILALAYMGIVSSERQTGAAIMVLVKPVSHVQYIFAKWLAMNVLTLVAIGVAQLGTWYYTVVLFEEFSLAAVAWSSLVYFVWLVFVNSMTLLFSCVLRSQAGAAFLSLGLAALLALVGQLLGNAMKWSPSKLTTEAAALVLRVIESPGTLWLPLGVTLAGIACLVAGSIAASRKMWLQG